MIRLEDSLNFGLFIIWIIFIFYIYSIIIEICIFIIRIMIDRITVYWFVLMIDGFMKFKSKFNGLVFFLSKCYWGLRKVRFLCENC